MFTDATAAQGWSRPQLARPKPTTIKNYYGVRLDPIRRSWRIATSPNDVSAAAERWQIAWHVADEGGRRVGRLDAEIVARECDWMIVLRWGEDWRAAPSESAVSRLTTPEHATTELSAAEPTTTAPAALTRACFAASGWARSLGIETLLIPTDLPHAAEIAADRRCERPSTYDSKPGLSGTQLRAGTGYLFLREGDEVQPSAPLRPGEIIRMSAPPPWLVVYESLPDVLANRWPCRLIEVEIIAPVGDERREVALANAGFTLGNRHTRQIAVRALREVNPAELFGQHGGAVIDVLNAALSLTGPQVQQLASARDERAGDLYSAAWERWSSESLPNVTLLQGGSDRGSPVGYALMLVHGLVWKAAEVLAPDAFEHDDEENWLTGPWGLASSALLEATLALGAPELFTDADQELLLKPWYAMRS